MTWKNAAPTLVLRRGNGEPTTEPLIGQRLSIEVDPSARRWCLGADGPSHVADSCPIEPEVGRKTCTSCSVKNALFAGALHHAHQQESTDPDLIKHLDQPNRLYLAAFRDGSIKVGTSTEHRAITRLLEQGAWMARFVASTTNGIVVRVVEDEVTNRLALPQSVAITRKLAGLASPSDDAWLSERLDSHAHRTAALIAEHTAPNKLSAIDESWHNPATSDALWNRVHPYTSDLTRGAHVLDVVGAVGSAVAFRRKPDGDVFVADLRPLLGLGLAELACDVEPDQVTVQDQLF